MVAMMKVAQPLPGLPVVTGQVTGHHSQIGTLQLKAMVAKVVTIALQLSHHLSKPSMRSNLKLTTATELSIMLVP